MAHAATSSPTNKRQGDSHKIKKKTEEKNGTESSQGTPAATTSSISSIPWTGLALALLALLLGLITPHLLVNNNKTPSEKQGPILIQPKPIQAKVITAEKKMTTSSSKERRRVQEDKTATTSTSTAAAACTDERLADFWHDQPVPGLHLICVSYTSPKLQSMLRLRFFRHATREETSFVDVPMPLPFGDLSALFASELALYHLDHAWAIFSTKGQKLVGQKDTDDTDKGIAQVLRQEGLVLLFEGGQFLWPGVRIGFRRDIELYNIVPGASPMLDQTRNVTLETLSLIPLVLSVEGFLTDDECDRIQRLAEPDMRYSEVVLMDRDAGRPASDFRTSQTTFLSAGDDKMLIDMDYRTASLVRIPRSHQEPVQVLRYEKGEHYASHNDYFDPRLYAEDHATQKLIEGGLRNRMATVFWYLSDVASGGETIFPRFNGGREKSMTDCETGLKVRPEKGKVIIFYSMTADGKIDPHSLHGACPVKDGLKWAGNKWVWNYPQGYVPP